MKRIKIFAALVIGVVVAFAVGCDGSEGANGGGGACPQANVSIAVLAKHQQPFLPGGGGQSEHA